MKERKGIFKVANYIRDVVNNVFSLRGTISGTSNAGTPAAWLQSFFGGTETWSGKRVTENDALEYIAFWACIKVIRETIASLPIILYKRTENGKERNIEHETYNVLHLKANPEQTIYDWKEMSINHYLLYGNAYSEKVMKNGYVKELWPLMPWNMEIKRIGGEKWYKYMLPNQKYKFFKQDEILHLPNFSLTGLKGERPLDYAHQHLGTSIATEEYGARFYNNDATPGGVLELPGNLGKGTVFNENLKRMKASWQENYGNLTNKHRVAILEDGAKFHETTIAPDKAQFIETRKFQRNMMASFYRLPPHLIGDLEKATYTNIEEQSLEFIRYTMLPHFVRIEQNLTTQLLTETEQKTLFFEILIDALTRADIEKRYRAYRTGREGGWLSPNDVRRMENMNTIENGDIYNVPLNWQELGAKPVMPAGNNQDDDSQDDEEQEENVLKPQKEQRTIRAAMTRKNIAASYRKVHQDIMTRIMKKEISDIKRNVKKWLVERTKEDFDKWYREYYDSMADYMQKRLYPVYSSINEAIYNEIEQEINMINRKEEQEEFVKGYVDRYIKEYSRDHKRNIGLAVSDITKNEKDPEESFQEMYDKWNRNLQNNSHDETVNSSNAFAKSIYLLGGIQFLRWINTGSEPCPFCQEMDGKIISIQDNFIGKGSIMEGGNKDLNISRNVAHPGLHNGCECQIMAG